MHEAFLAGTFDTIRNPDVAARLSRYHTTAEQAGEVAAKAGVRSLVLTHVIPPGREEEFVAAVRRHFKGEVVVGHDLMRFRVEAPRQRTD